MIWEFLFLAWKVEEGAEFAAGDSLAEIETDKASIDFEAQDDGFVAKYLIEPGVEVAVGKPIMVTVEEEDQVAAFKDFTLADVAGDDDPVAAVEEKESPVVAEAAPPAPEPVKEVKVEAPPPPVAVAPTPPPPAPVAIEEMPSSVESSGIAWDPLQKMNSPLAKSLALAQSEYHDLYGPTGHRPLLMEE